MTYTFKLSKRLAQCYGALLSVAAFWACAAERGLSPFPPDTTQNQPVPIASITIAPALDSGLVGTLVRFTAMPKDAAGNPLSGRVVTWSSNDTLVAAIDATGLAALHGPGSTLITAAAGGIAGHAQIAVLPPPVASVAVSPSALTMLTGTAAQLTAVPQDGAGSPLAGRTVAWSTSAAAIATVNASGLVTSLSPGTVTITATSEGKSGTATVTVTAVPVASVSVTPATASLFVSGTVQLTAATKDSAGGTLTGRVVTWTTSNAGVASVSASGSVTGVSAGSATIAATSEGRSATATVTVTAVPVASVTVTPATASLFVAGAVQLTATTKDSAGGTLTARVVTWTTSNAGVATVSPSGRVTGVSAGSATITATSEGQTGTASMTVAVVPVATVAVTPATASLFVAGTVQLTATTKDSAGGTLTGRVVTWSSSNPAVATVSAGGLVTGAVPGSATIMATSEGKTGSATITVTTATVSHQGYYVSPGGSASGTGSITSPWSLATALAGANGKVQPGDTIWVRGGTYYAPFRSTLNGNALAPVVVRAYPGERATIDGVNTTNDNFVVAGSYTVLWGLEFTNTAPSRYTTVINHNYRANNVVNDGSHNKYVNLVVHDGGVAFFNYSVRFDVEITGCVFYNNGWEAPDRGHGHGMYLKSDVGPVVAKDNVIFNQYGYGIHVYTNTGSGLLNNIQLIGNVSFDNGSLSSLGTSANLGNLGQPLANDLGVVNNMTFFAPSLSGTNLTLGSGAGLIATGNYVVGGGGITQGTWTNAVINTNTVFAAGPASRPAAIFVRPNPYEPGRANVIVYNWSGQGSVSVDLSQVLTVGDRFEVRNVQDLYGAPVASGTFGGGSISLPMTGVTPPVPVGLSSSPAPTTGPYFDVFIVVKL